MYITKIDILSGVYWIEIKEVNLRILCGSPADSVKHLIKKGLCLWVEQNGVKFETGPNAILLSDISIQNGQLSNLCEFPVLQMLYRQGMIIPNHPNNNGTKPLLIGSTQQVTSQINYIYRGNYGLISKEEIMQAGYSAKKADKIMKMKLKFAFGKMVDTNELLNKVILNEDKKVLIKDEVSIQRTSTNVFEISYKGENVTVDLNLDKRQKYESPYPLNYFNIQKEYFAVIHSGQGDGWNINQPSMSSVLMYQGKIYLIDAGPNIEYILESLGIGISEIEGVFHTHSHDDHFVGLTSLIKSDKKIKYYATKLIRESVVKKLTALLNIEEEKVYSYFEIIDLKFDKYTNINGLEVKPVFSPHPVETNMFIFRTFWKNGYKSYAHYADTTSLDVLEKMITQNSEEIGISQYFYNKTKKTYLEYADIKKIDIGGGMIHGDAKDFKDDNTKKIILAHSSKEYNDEEKEIGSSAAFGTLNVLIKSKQSYDSQNAFKYLSSYHSDLPTSILNTFLNLEIETINPGTIFLKKGQKVKNIFILLSGVAESIYSDKKIVSSLTAGSMIGKMNGIFKFISDETVRAISYIKVLKIPTKMFINAVKSYGLYPQIEGKMDKVFFLKQNILFNEDISNPVLEKIATNMNLEFYKKGTIFSLDNRRKLYLIDNGTIHMKLGNRVANTLEKGDFFGEEYAIFKLPGIYSCIAQEDISVYSIEGSILEDIPIIRWKIFESIKKKEKTLLHCEGKYIWNERFKINVQSMDIEHERIFFMINNIYALANMSDIEEKRDDLISLTNSLIEYIKQHLENEEKLLQMYQYPICEKHIESHNEFKDRLYRFLNEIEENKKFDSNKIVTIIFDWFVIHIEFEDKKFGKYLNEKGIY